MPNKTKPLSLRRKLLFRLLVPVVPLLLAGVAIAFYMSYHFVNLAYNRSLFRATLSLADQVVVIDGKVTVDLPQAAFEMLEYDRDDWIYYKVTGPQGEFITGYQALPAPPLKHPVPGQHYYYSAQYDGKDISVAAFYLSLKGTSANGVVLVQVGETTAKRELVAEEIISGMVVPQLLMVILATFMLWRGIGQGLAPLESLRKQISARSHRDLSPLDVTDSPREVLPILDAMNDLIARLQATMAQQQRFVDDASHQLRTPLAGLKTQAEIALHAENTEETRHALQQILASSSSLAHLVRQLLSLARLDPNAADALQFTAVNLFELATEVTRAWVPAALEKRIDLGFEAPAGHLVVTGNAILLRELLVNLIDNALRYTPATGRVTVKLHATSSTAELCVEDNGPGIPQTQRARVFERFYRILGTDEAGCGLGLSIVHEIALRHGAQVILETPSNGTGTLVRVVFSH